VDVLGIHPQEDRVCELRDPHMDLVCVPLRAGFLRGTYDLRYKGLTSDYNSTVAYSYDDCRSGPRARSLNLVPLGGRGNRRLQVSFDRACSMRNRLHDPSPNAIAHSVGRRRIAWRLDRCLG
jgi:hypothetical protein